MKRAILYVAWGDHLEVALNSIRESNLPEYPIFILTTDDDGDAESKLSVGSNVHFIRCDLSRRGHSNKTILFEHLPPDFDSFLYLDNDTVILDDVSLGFEKAEQFSIALSSDPFYSLDAFWGIDKVLRAEGVPLRDVLLFNSGVIFFVKNETIRQLFAMWAALADQHVHTQSLDQGYLTLALEKCGINPYVLSNSYNLRNPRYIVGRVRIWHSYRRVPKKINCYSSRLPRALLFGSIRTVSWHPQIVVRRFYRKWFAGKLGARLKKNKRFASLVRRMKGTF